jgi:nitrogen fixation protein NifU and related proteins
VSVAPHSDAGVSVAPHSDAGVSVAPPSDAGVSVAPPSDAGVSLAPPSDAGVSLAPPSDAGVSLAPPSDAGVSLAPPSDAGALAAFQTLVLARNRERLYLGAPAQFQRHAHGANALCGDAIEVFLTLQGEQIQQARYQGEMSAISFAAAEILCAALEGQALVAAERILQACLQLFRTPEALFLPDNIPSEFAAFAIVRRYPNRQKTATLPIATLLAAVAGDLGVVSTE